MAVDFYCSACRKHKKLSLFSRKTGIRSFCLSCDKPPEEKEKLGINLPPEFSKQRQKLDRATKTHQQECGLHPHFIETE